MPAKEEHALKLTKGQLISLASVLLALLGGLVSLVWQTAGVSAKLENQSKIDQAQNEKLGKVEGAIRDLSETIQKTVNGRIHVLETAMARLDEREKRQDARISRLETDIRELRKK